MRRRYQLTRNRVQLHNRLEALLEEAHLRLPSLVSDLLGTSARRMLQAVGDGATETAAVAALADQRLRDACPTGGCARGLCHAPSRTSATPDADAGRNSGCWRHTSATSISRWRSSWHRTTTRFNASRRSPGSALNPRSRSSRKWGVTAATFPSAGHLASWVGVCPGHEETAGGNYSPRCPKGNRPMRRVLNQAANAAVRAKGTIFAVVYRRLVVRRGHAQAIGAIAHRLCRLVWKIPHEIVVDPLSSGSVSVS